MGHLTAHVLDIAQGKPGAGVQVELFRLEGNLRQLLSVLNTNANGRLDHSLLEGKEFVSGKYELVFDVADYFRREGVALASPPFFDSIVIRFGVADPSEHYHIPLLISPWSYSTYRGS